MKTPIQEFLEEKKYHYYPDICKKWLQKEKEFAKQCFEAGENYYKGNHNAFSERYPKFEEFYKQFEQ